LKKYSGGGWRHVEWLGPHILELHKSPLSEKWLLIEILKTSFKGPKEIPFILVEAKAGNHYGD
jgi:hypothetical protein